MVILIGGEKGGTGKTTLATNLAALRAQSGKDVLLLDTDVQASASYWAQIRDERDITPRVSLRSEVRAIPSERGSTPIGTLRRYHT